MADPFVGENVSDSMSGEKAIASMSFEEALAELESIVQGLERGQLDLEASIGAYERGTLLRQHCAEKLRQAQMRVDKLTFDADGKARLTPLDPAS
jgi:exodeoxyribonuclease VII small subunit